VDNRQRYHTFVVDTAAAVEEAVEVRKAAVTCSADTLVTVGRADKPNRKAVAVAASG
jgi:hypothetical protein